MNAFLETLIGGLLSGTMYSLVAIGFVLIYKASGIFNFAQGAMLLLAAQVVATALQAGAPWPLAIGAAVLVIVMLAFAVERWVLAPLANQPEISLIMATLGLSYALEGIAQGLMGSEVRQIDLGIEDVPIFVGDILISQFDLVAASVAIVLVVALAFLFHRTRIGVSLRAVADDTRAALSIGIRLRRVWRIVWIAAGLVGLVAGLMWGARQGVQFALSLVVLKALPVLIIGGFTSIMGAIVGGLIVGAAENLGEAYLGPLIGGGITPWFAYYLAMICLYIRPYGLFGEEDIRRV